MQLLIYIFLFLFIFLVRKARHETISAKQHELQYHKLTSVKPQLPHCLFSLNFPLL